MVFALLSSPPGDKSISDDSGNVGGEDHSLVRGAPRPGQVRLLFAGGRLPGASFLFSGAAKLGRGC